VKKTKGISRISLISHYALALAHRKLDEAVFAAYGWDPSLSDDEILAKLLELNQAR